MEENIAITPESNELISKNEWVLIWRRLRAKKLAMISLVLIVIIYVLRHNVVLYSMIVYLFVLFRKR